MSRPVLRPTLPATPPESLESFVRRAQNAVRLARLGPLTTAERAQLNLLDHRITELVIRRARLEDLERTRTL